MHRPLLALLALATFGVQLPAQGASSQPGAVSGIVFDSIAGAPLRDALVQLDSPERYGRSATTDSLGWFTMRDVPPGRYTIGFLHPMLDSLGLEPPLRRLEVGAGRHERVELAIPAPSRVRAAVCGPAGAGDSGAVVVGTVRDALSHLPVAGVNVVGEWLEITFHAGGMRHRMPRRVATTGANGWFALCNVPRGGTMVLKAGSGGDSTDLVELQVPDGGFARRELFLGTARTVDARNDSASGGATPPARHMRTGDGRLRGSVVAVDGSRPVPGAQLRIVDGPGVRSDAQGEWVLVGIPAGTRMLEVRALGFYPERIPVDVIDRGPPVRIGLRTMRAVLETILVTASRTYDQSGFLTRRRAGAGRYMTAEEIQHRHPVSMSEIFRWIPGVTVEPAPEGGRTITMRGAFGDRCTPAVFVDGRHLRGVEPDDLDGWVSPGSVRGVEVYSAGTAPPEFAPSGLAGAGMGVAEGGCGVVVLWTR